MAESLARGILRNDSASDRAARAAPRSGWRRQVSDTSPLGGRGRSGPLWRQGRCAW